MVGTLSGRRVAILATDGFEQVELTEPLRVLQEENAEVHVIAPKSGEIQGFNHDEKGDVVSVHHALSQVKPEDYDALVLPGGVMNPDALRLVPEAIDFIRHFVQAKKPIAAICHGPWTLINAGGVNGKTMTSWPSLEADLRNAGANWVDREVVVDNGLVTSRNPGDLPAFCRAMVEEIAEGRHTMQAAATNTGGGQQQM